MRGEGSFLRNHELSSHKRPLQRRGQVGDSRRAGAGSKVPVQYLCSVEGVRIAEWAVLLDTRLMTESKYPIFVLHATALTLDPNDWRPWSQISGGVAQAACCTSAVITSAARLHHSDK